MNIHEYQAKEILRKYGISVPDGKMALSPSEAREAAASLDSNIYVVKAQIHAGGRGKAGGVKVVKSLDEVEKITSEMLGSTLVTHQTGPEGQKVSKVYIEAGSNIKNEYYLSLVVDRATNSISFVASKEGGMEIEEVASKTPEKILTIPVNHATGISDFHVRKIAYLLELTEKNIYIQLNKIVKTLYQAFIETDASQIEINPLVLTAEDNLILLDGKFNFDDNALYRHPDIVKLRDKSEENELDLRANDAGLAYIALDGNIGCMVNGAGLAMATMDIIKYYNQKPANFLDVGGGATKEKVIEAFKIIISDAKVEAILVNIFGGIMKCDIIADGIVAAVKEVGLNRPLVVRLEGTNVEKGKEILDNSGLAITSANDLNDAAKKVVALV